MRLGSGARVAVAGVDRAGSVAKLLRDFNAEFATPCPELDTLTRRFAELIAGNHGYVVLAESPEPVGFALLTLRPSPYYDGPIATLDELYVRPGLRGRGIGTRLMDCAEAEACARHVGEVQINVDAVDVGVRRFYEGRGYTNIEAGQDVAMLCYIREFGSPAGTA